MDQSFKSHAQFLDIILHGTPFIDMKEFYTKFDMYKKYSNKKRIKFFIYSAYYVDKYKFKTSKNWERIKIINKNTNKVIDFNLKKYLTYFLKEHNLSSKLDESEFEFNLSDNCKEISICNSTKLNKEHLKIIGESIYFACNMLESILQEFRIEDKLLKKWSTFDLNDVQKIDMNEYYNDVKTIYSKVKKLQYNDKNKGSHIFEQYKGDLKNLDVTFKSLSRINIKKNNQIEILKLRIWDILMSNNYTSYLSSPNTVNLEVKYIGQAFGNNGERNVYDRIGGGHEHIQRLMATCPDNKEVAINFFRIELRSEFGGFGGDPKLKDILKEKIVNKTDNVTADKYVNITELALITFFKPSDNVELKNRKFSASNNDLKIINEINLKYNGVLVYMNIIDENIKMFSQERPLGEAFIPSKNIIQYKFDSTFSFLIPFIKQY
ncbi:hypothetical protein FP435_00280 (plasmid) [Lactobacillus sp. PV037]|uniref:hypothetical protein n=1 Tax=Lactobacillus sp. PV037 TaxID=2594496 RepID=UPI00223F1A5F|nr:hypothetical protein [Lactobacillus sp. PV037]QNQ82974.1 hypothetical protein FP435_00280 [Lactobacillus sp. PV037]